MSCAEGEIGDLEADREELLAQIEELQGVQEQADELAKQLASAQVLRSLH